MNKELVKKTLINLIDHDILKIKLTDDFLEIDIDRSLVLKAKGHTIFYSNDGKLIMKHKETHINPIVKNNENGMDYIKNNIDNLAEEYKLPKVKQGVCSCSK